MYNKPRVSPGKRPSHNLDEVLLTPKSTPQKTPPTPENLDEVLHELHQLPHLLYGEYQLFLVTDSSPTWLARRRATCRICSNLSHVQICPIQKICLIKSYVPSCVQAQYLHFRRCVCDCIMIVVRIHVLRMGGWVSSTTVPWVSSAIYSCTRQV